MSRPYTVRFGPWAPDLQDVGVEMPYQWSDTELPVADCLNVYWQDGAYRSLPQTVSFGPSLGTPALDCFTWYDNTQQKEVVFAATANGFFTLIDGVWTEIATQTNETGLGMAIGFQLGAPVGLATAMSPTSRSASGGASSYTFPALSAVIGYGTASAYSWSFSGASGPGSWSIASGQGTSSAAPQVTGATSGTTSSVTLKCAITFSGTVYNISGTLSYTYTFAAVTHSYTSGTATETVPTGASHVTIEVWGGGAPGGQGNLTAGTKGGGGGASGYSRSYYSCSGGQTLSYSVGAANNSSSVSSGTLAITTMHGNPGSAGGNAGSSSNGSGGAGGAASGGNQANTTGGAGVTGGTGGVAPTGIYANTTPTYGDGGAGSRNTTINVGNGGLIAFHYT